MKVVLQRCKEAQVCVSEKVVGSIKKGVMLLVGFTEGDGEEEIIWMAKKIANLRIFPDQVDVMNLSLMDVKGEILAVSQFTLYANTKKGNRPSYIEALENKKAEILYEKFCLELQKYSKVEKGIFGADMDVSFTNWGPVTILLERNAYEK